MISMDAFQPARKYVMCLELLFPFFLSILLFRFYDSNMVWIIDYVMLSHISVSYVVF